MGTSAYTKERLEAAVAQSKGWADLMRRLGVGASGGRHRTLQAKVAEYGIDAGHFKRRTWGNVRVAAPKPIAAKVFRVRPEGSSRENRDRLHRALAEVGVPYRCADCGNQGEWRGRSVTLQIDHISGDWLDNHRENLRYLCPNCHAVTDTWCRGGARYDGRA
ncbi:HNH endonuclease signature motif containing protein [Streptomyces wedmorensis]